MARKEITGSMTVRDIVITMAEGNPGALSVLMQLIQHPKANTLDILNFDDMNMRGPQIWIAYKDHCGEDMALLVELIRKRDLALISTVNAQYPKEKAVSYGGSFKRPRLDD